MHKTIDYIIVGQGIAGSMVAHTLLSRNKNIVVIDEYNPNSSSNIAAGVVNPVTGRKMVKSWMIDEVLPFAKKTYRALENKLNANFFYEKKLIKIFSSDEDEKLWRKKMIEESYQQYLGDIIPAAQIHPSVQAPYGAGVIQNACWLDVPTFTSATRTYLKNKNILSDEKLDFTLLQIENHITYKNIKSNNIIFCEGYKAYLNPYFKDIPFSLAKGEHIVVQSSMLKTDDILTKNIFVIPKGNNMFNIGSTFIWDDKEETMTAEGRAEILQKFKKISKDDFVIIEEKAAIRPTMKDRRPVLGKHKIYNNMYIFNGLGTKGVSLAPYFSNYFADFLETNSPILKEVSLQRFDR